MGEVKVLWIANVKRPKYGHSALRAFPSLSYKYTQMQDVAVDLQKDSNSVFHLTDNSRSFEFKGHKIIHSPVDRRRLL